MPTAALDKGDTAWVLICSAFVLLMTLPGLAFFYGGMVRQRNVLATLLQSLAALCVVSLQWVLFGYSLAFGPDKGGLIGGLEWLGLSGVGPGPSSYAPTIPHQAFMLFQMMFAVITPALITGAFAERKRFAAYLLFVLLWTTLVYDPLAHWVWAEGGFLRKLGALDFAGGTVVHLSSGVSALVCALVIGKRRGYPHTPMPPHNLPLTMLGAGLLWFGWFGFNAGSALEASGVAANAFLATNTAASAAALGWMLLEWKLRGKPTALGTASGAVAGLVAITPACGFVGPMAAIAIGAGGGVLCFAGCHIKARVGYDDALDVVGVHGVGGVWGAIATGLFAWKAVNGAGGDGLFHGNPSQLLTQLVAVGATVALAAPMTFLILKIVDVLVGLRVDEEHELTGLDLSLHSENAYVLGGATAGEHLTGRPRHDAVAPPVLTPALGRER
ncbi:MAG TPA: ammonium transporter [Myxococcales bacterium]|nr:ammonium transporter [Myxococcales bacterium]